MLKIACLAAALVLCMAANATTATASYIRGSAVGEIALAGYEGQTLRADLQAFDPATDGEAGGAFHVAHYLVGGEVFGESWGTADCVKVADGVAHVTGTITKGAAPGAGYESLRGQRVALTITDGDPDELLFDLSILHTDAQGQPIDPQVAITPCQRARVPINLSWGDYWLGFSYRPAP